MNKVLVTFLTQRGYFSRIFSNLALLSRADLIVEPFQVCHPKLNSTLNANLTWINEILHSFKLRGQGAIKNRAHF